MGSSNEFYRLLLSSILVVMLQMMMLKASASVVGVSVAPSTIQVGLSPSLDVNCTFSTNTTSAMAAIFSLSVYRGNNSDLASITSFADHQVNVISNEGITADGVINPGGQSYIHLHWDYPTDTQKGTYQCVARGIDNLGENVEAVNTSVVNVDQVDLQDLVNDCRQMQIYMHQLEQRVKTLESETKNGLSALFLDPPLIYNNKQYYVSRYAFHYFNESIDICKALGGMLLEIDDEDEYHAIQQFMREHFKGLTGLHIGGVYSTVSGNWVLPSTNQPLPVIDWGDHKATRDTCLGIGVAYGWRMYSTDSCNIPQTLYQIRYICEINVI